MVSVAVRAPAAVGWKVILTVQTPVVAGIFAPLVQVFVPIAKSPAFVPLIAGVPEIETAAEVKLLSVTVCGPLVVPTNWLVANVSGLGLTLTMGFAPVPLRVTGCAPNVPSVIVRVAVRGLLIAVGVNVMFTMQVPLSAGIFAPAVQVVPAAIA